MFRSAFKKEKSPKLMETPSNKKSSRYPSGYGIQIRLKNEESAESIYSQQIETAIIFLFMLAGCCKEPQIVALFRSAKLALRAKHCRNFYNSAKWDNWNFYNFLAFCLHDKPT
ncbi:hypothetical protein TcasGA2_TC003084 [Tribolium castaneum]|uniref:Uncharacterized protein n=1 Tax=Tribolium castaneum TaxID=7070 RepID=D6WFF8_TRICA|nr:hypothetical protein TcasGA2_TC003084 [Tribolium castaneum]